MRLSLMLIIIMSRTAQAQGVTDVPVSHWAYHAAQAVVKRGVMSAAGGKFNGSNYVTRTEWAITLAGLVKSLEGGAWSKSDAKPVSDDRSAHLAPDGPVTRYEAAAVIYRIAPIAVSGGLTPSADMANLFVAVKGDDPFAYVAQQTRNLPVWIFHGEGSRFASGVFAD